jgi:TolB-like protein
MSLGRIYDELRRRNVIRVASAYAVVAWLILQIASIVFPTFDAPPWLMQGVTVLLVAGFPISVVLAWIFQITAEGIVADSGDASVTTPAPPFGRTVDFVIIGVLAMAVALFAYDEYFIETPNVDVDRQRRPAVAFVPAEAQGRSEELDIFIYGIADEMVRRLSSWPNFPAISTATSFSANVPTDVLEAGDYFDARYVASVNATSNAERLEVDIELTDTTDGRSIWSDAVIVDRDVLGDILALEEEVIGAIIGQINPALLRAESERAIRQDSANIDAWTAAHRGWWYVNRETESDYRESLAWFERAIELEPNWSWPHAAKSLAYYRAILNGWGEGSREANQARNQMMFELAERAVGLDPNDSFAHHAYGHALANRGRGEESLAALARGVELNPNDAMANACYGMQLAAANRADEAILVGERAVALSPHDPWEFRFALVLTRAYFAAANYERAQAMAIRSNALRPNQFPLIHLIAATALAGDVELAKQRAIDFRDQILFPTVEVVVNVMSRSTDSDYVARLAEGLRLAEFAPATPVE